MDSEFGTGVYHVSVHGKVERISWIAFIAVLAAGAMIGFLTNNASWIDLLTGQYEVGARSRSMLAGGIAARR